MEFLQSFFSILPNIKTVLLAIIPLGFLIFIHELGHFYAAKRAGIKVNTFSLGFGPKLIGFQRGVGFTTLIDGLRLSRAAKAAEEAAGSGESTNPGADVSSLSTTDTEYRLSLLPFGGYVQMEGENPKEQTGAVGEFGSASLGNRAFVVAAGPAVNLLFGVLAFWLVFAIGLNQRSVTFIEGLTGKHLEGKKEGPQLGAVAPEGPAAHGGLEPGDIILSVNDTQIENWAAFHIKIYTSPGRALEIEVERQGTRQTFTVVPNIVPSARGDTGELQVISKSDIMVTDVAAGSLAEQAGIQVGDRVETINGEKIYNVPEFGSGIWAAEAIWLSQHYQSLYRSIQQNPNEFQLGIRRGETAKVLKMPVTWELTAVVQPDAEVVGLQNGDTLLTLNGNAVDSETLSAGLKAAASKPIELRIRRGNSEKTVTLSPNVKARAESAQATSRLYGFGWTTTLSGISFGEPPRVVPTYTVFTAFGKGLETSWLTVASIGRTLKQLINREVSPRYLTGPIGIANATSRMFNFGFTIALFFIGFISINLAIVNLLPIPIADGGHLLFFAVEKIRGRPISLEKQAIVQHVSIILLIALFLYITWFDGLSLIDDIRN